MIISAHYSPHVLLGKRNLDYAKQYSYEFGEFLITDQETDPTNTPRARGVDSIYLRPRTDVPQGGHYTMNLQTGLVLTAKKVTRVPLTERAIIWRAGSHAASCVVRGTRGISKGFGYHQTPSLAFPLHLSIPCPHRRRTEARTSQSDAQSLETGKRAGASPLPLITSRPVV